MIWIQGGVFRMGSDHHYQEEGPSRRVGVDGFWIDAGPVTNRQFARFVDAAGWVTTAEKPSIQARRPRTCCRPRWCSPHPPRGAR